MENKMEKFEKTEDIFNRIAELIDQKGYYFELYKFQYLRSDQDN